MSRRCAFSFASLVLLVVFGLFDSPAVEAAERFWIDPAGGPFGLTSNWSATDGGAGGATVPTTTDVANFTLNNTYDVTFSALVTNTDLDVENGNVTFDLNGLTYTATSVSAIEIGKVRGQTGRLTITVGTVGVDTVGDNVQVGVVDGSTGFLTVSTAGQLGAAAARPNTYVGDSGSGTLTVQGDGEVFAASLTVGVELGATGTVTVTGPRASLDASSTLTIGDAGAGTMTISNGADFVGAGIARLGALSASTGTLTITGAGSTWTQSTAMTVGDGGVGTLNVQSSGSLTTGAMTIGNSSIGIGMATVSSGGSASTQGITVGSAGSGALTVTGAGSSLTTNGLSFTVGSSTGSEGDVTVSLGGTIIAGSVTLGNFSGSRGSLAVSGSTSSFTSFSGGFFSVGLTGAGSLEITSGATVNSPVSRIATSTGSTGSATVSGTGSTWNANSLAIGGQQGTNGGTGTLTIESGGMVNVSSTTEVRSSAGSALTLDGGTLSTVDFTRLGALNFRNGMLHVKGVYDHGAAPAPLVINGASAVDLPTLRLSGNAAVNDVTTITVGNNNQGALVLDSGRTLNVGANNVSIGAGALSSGTVTLSDASLVTTGILAVGGSGSTDGGTGVLNINPRGVADVGSLNLASGGTINLNGGTLRVPSFLPIPMGGRINFNAGEIAYTITTVVSDDLLDTMLGPSHVLGPGQRFSNTTGFVFDAPLTVSGGDLFAGTSIGNSSTLQINDGSLVANTVSNSAGRLLTIAGTAIVSAATGITNDGTIQLDNNLVATRGGTLTNNGTIRGSGFIGNNLTNNAAGQVQATAGNRLEFQGATNINSGSVSLVGGEIVFTGSLTNSASTGLISSGDAILRVNSGITNNGSLAVPFGLSHLFGDINNKDSVVVSGGALATFYDDITQDGTFRVSKVGSTTSTAVVLGDFTGGGSTGGGDIFFEGDLRPGNSAATVEFDNNVAFGSGGTLEIELGGTTPGLQYDQVHVSGHLSLDGTLAVSLINDFLPAAGNSFDILDWGSLSGTFDTLQLPPLATGLEWNASELYTSGVLSVAAVGLAGDYNQNGTVDAADFVLWRKNLGSGTSLANDDTPGVGPDDYTRWRANFGRTAASGTAGISDVPVNSILAPEPSGLIGLLLALACAWIAAQRLTIRVT